MSKSLIQALLIVPVLFLFAASRPLRAEFQITVDSGNIDPAGALLLEIGIESTTSPQTLNLAEFDLVLQITPISATAGTSLQFVDPQSEAVLDSADYVFAATSDVIADPFPDASLVSQNSGNTITFTDLSIVGGDFVDVPVSTRKLFATIDLQHSLNGANAAETLGDQFEISVDLSPFATLLADAAGDEFEPFATSGIVTVGAVAIPEPSAFGMLAIVSCAVVLRRRR